MAITGFAVRRPAWTGAYVDTLDASEGCATELVGEVYDLVVRPDGVRCTWQDGNVNILGTDPVTGFAARPLDNVGVQYGLRACATAPSPSTSSSTSTRASAASTSTAPGSPAVSGPGTRSSSGRTAPGWSPPVRPPPTPGRSTTTGRGPGRRPDHRGEQLHRPPGRHPRPPAGVRPASAAPAPRRLRPDPRDLDAPAVGNVASVARQLPAAPRTRASRWCGCSTSGSTPPRQRPPVARGPIAWPRPSRRRPADRCELPTGEILTGDDVYAEGRRVLTGLPGARRSPSGRGCAARQRRAGLPPGRGRPGSYGVEPHRRAVHDRLRVFPTASATGAAAAGASRSRRHVAGPRGALSGPERAQTSSGSYSPRS